MTPEKPPVDAPSLWRKQPSEDVIVTLEDIQGRVQSFQSVVSRRNLREYFGALSVIVVFAWYVWVLPGWMSKTGSALVIADALFVMRELHRRGSAQPPPAAAALPLVEFHRAELIRQRDLLKSVPLWYLAPFIPGLVMMALARYFQIHVEGRSLAADRQIVVLANLVVLLVFGAVWLLNVWAAARIQRKIDALDNLKVDPAGDTVG